MILFDGEDAGIDKENFPVLLHTDTGPLRLERIIETELISKL